MRHAIKCGHIPPIFHPDINTPSIHGRRVACLARLTELLLAQVNPLTELVKFAENMGFGVPEKNFVRVEPKSAAVMEGIYRDENPDEMPDIDFNVILPTGNHVGILGHWRVLSDICARISVIGQGRQRLQQLSDTYALEEEEAKAVYEASLAHPKAFDSHFHFDRLFESARKPLLNMDELLAMPKHPDYTESEHQVNLLGAIANYCDPSRWPNLEALESMNTQFKPTIGVHPKKLHEMSKEKFDELMQLMRSPKVAGLGEVGLDIRDPSDYQELDQQKKKLLGLLQLAIGEFKDKVLVLHCRGSRMNPGHVDAMYNDLCNYLRSAEVPKEKLIHLHCYTGSAETLRFWISKYPNTYVGFVHAAGDPDVIAQIPIARMLLETDSPHFAFETSRKSISYPCQIGQTAVAVAAKRGVDWEWLAERTAENATRLYSLNLPPQ
jgi:TatD DNase family protein